MKNCFKLLIAIIFVCFLFACKNNDTKKYDYKIGLIPSETSINDQSYNQTAWEGLKRFSKDHKNVKVSYIESKVEADFLVNAQIFIDSGYDLIIGTGYQFKTCFEEISKENPSQKFLLVDSVIENRDNLSCITFSMEEASYLAGVVAASVSKTGKIGVIVGNNSSLLNAFGVGYIEGAKSIRDDIIIYQENINSFTDATLAKVVANSMITNNADVIFSAAGAAGSGAISACTDNNVYAIGVDTDQSFIDPKHVITSAIKGIDNVIYKICEELINGKFISGARNFDLSSKCIGIIKNDKMIPKEVLEKVDEVENAIKDKKIIVHSAAKDCPDYKLAK